MDDLTFIIKTFDRLYCIKRLVRSIFKKYPDARVLIADDSLNSCKEYFKNHYPDKKIEVYELQEDVGLSAGRNFLVDKVETEYFVLLDDDFVFDKKTNIEAGLDVLKDKGIDILGGFIRNYIEINNFKSFLKYLIQVIIKYEKPDNYLGTIQFDQVNRILHIDYIKTQFPKYVYTDIVLNFFIAKTEIIRNINRWDDDLKLQEHTAFFFKAKKNGLKVGFSNCFSVEHKPIRLNGYKSFRLRDYTRVFMRKNGIIRIESTFDNRGPIVVQYEE